MGAPVSSGRCPLMTLHTSGYIIIVVLWCKVSIHLTFVLEEIARCSLHAQHYSEMHPPW
jgi:hypothetical protein